MHHLEQVSSGGKVGRGIGGFFHPKPLLSYIKHQWGF